MSWADRQTFRLRCSEKLSADLHLLSACTFVALRTQQIGVVRQPVSQISFQQFVKLDEFDMTMARVAQPATRVYRGVDTTCWQLFRPDVNTVHFYFLLLQKLCQITWLQTGWKIFSLLPEAPWGLRPEARGICHICHIVNPALDMPLAKTCYSSIPRSKIVSYFQNTLSMSKWDCQRMVYCIEKL